MSGLGDAGSDLGNGIGGSGANGTPRGSRLRQQVMVDEDEGEEDEQERAGGMEVDE
jgi:hypothetical protein